MSNSLFRIIMNAVKISFLRTIDALRAAFISLVPYYILYSIIILSVEMLKHFSFFGAAFTPEQIDNIVRLTTTTLLPLLLNMSISYHLASICYVSINKFLATVLSLIVYFSVEVIIHQGDSASFFMPKSFILALLVPLLCTYLLAKTMQMLEQYQRKINTLLSSNVATMVVYIAPFALIYFAATFIFSMLGIHLQVGSSIVLFQETQEALLLLVRTVASTVLWFFGVHGINLFDSIVNIKILDHFMHPNLTYKDFFNYFVLLGGLGSGLSLAIAIVLASKDKHTTYVGKLAFPFVAVNINEILIFGIPIFMNFSLILPFILTPVVNFCLAYLFLSYTHVVTFSDVFIPWTTPALVNMYLATGGNLIAVAFQLFLIALGTLIYIPFIKKYTYTQSSTASLENMAKKFDVTTSIEAKKDIKFHEAQSSLIKSHYKINKIIESINQNNLVLYYQPKIDVQNNVCNAFEALLRIKNSDGSVRGPDFIIDIENSGLASILDIWVCQQVKKDLDLWAEQGFYPEVSINLFPHTLEDNNYVNEIINIAKGYAIDFEIIERRSSLNQKIFEHIHLLKKNDFGIALDDFGIGYTNFSMLYEMPLDYVKIDKKIINFTDTEKGLILYNSICQLCASLHLKIILEGVETQEERDRLMNKEVRFIQGWYYAKALPFDAVVPFSKNFPQPAL